MLNSNRYQVVKITHPLIKDAYIKKEAADKNHEQDVLVLETIRGLKATKRPKTQTDLSDLLLDLQDLKDQAVKKCGSIDRIDIYQN